MDNKCEVCGINDKIGVISSIFGAISYGICSDCLAKGKEPWPIIVGRLFGLNKEGLHEDFKEEIKKQCLLHNKTEDQLWEEVMRVKNNMKKK